MSRNITAVAKPLSGTASAPEIPQDVKDDVEAIYAHLTAHPDQEGFAEFANNAEREKFHKDAMLYCRTRAAGVLKFRKLNSKNLPPNQMRFQITADLAANADGQSPTV